jgi:hypothetical protein
MQGHKKLSIDQSSDFQVVVTRKERGIPLKPEGTNILP